MRRGISVLFALLIAALVAPSHATAQVRPWEISIAGGPSFPISDFEDQAGTGYHIEGSVGFELPMLPVGLRADLLWQEFTDNAEDDDEWFRQIGGLANAVIAIPLVIVEPYAVIGGGLIRTDTPEVFHAGHSHTGEASTDPAFAAGIGLQFPFLGLDGFAEARYLQAFGDGPASDYQAIPLTVGIRF